MVGRAQAQRKGERAVALGHLIALIDVEKRHGLGKLAGPLAHDLLDARRGDIGGHDESNIFLGQRERRDTLDLDGCLAHLRDQRIHVDLECARTGRQAEGAARSGRQLASKSDIDEVTASAHEDARDAARVERSDRSRIRRRSRHRGTLVRRHLIHPGTGHLHTNPESRRHATHVLEGVGPVVSAGVRQDIGRNSLAGQDTANVPGLSRDTGLKRRDHLVGGTFLSAGQLRRHGTRGTGNLCNLEDRNVCVGARHITAGDVEEGIEHRGAQPGGVIRHRVAQAQRLATRIVGGDTLTVPSVRHERIGLDLDQSAIGQRSGGQATSLLRGRQAMACRCGRHDHGNVVVAVEACDFLDQVGWQREIGTPRGSRHRERAIVGAFDDAADRAQ